LKICATILSVFGSSSLGIVNKIKPKSEFLIWLILMTFWLGFLMYGLVLTLNSESPLLAKNNLSNKITVIVSLLFLISGFLYYRRRMSDFPDKNIKC
jgi:hypothetical protein